MTMNSPDWERQLAKDVPFAGERVAANIRKVKERIRLDEYERKKIRLGPWAAAIVVMLVGGLFLWRGQEVQDLLNRWTDGPNKNTVKPITHDPVTLKVAINVPDAQYFYNHYGRLLMLRYNWLSFDVKVIQPSANDAQNDYQDYRTKLEQEKPDLLMISGDVLAPPLVANGILKPLDDSIKQDNYDLNALHPAVTALLKAEGNGKLYGLTPFMQGQALFYNKDLFDKYQVPYPKDKNTWEELLTLAKKFPVSGEAGKELIGLEDGAAYSTYRIMVEMAQSADLFRPDADKNRWAAIWNEVLGGAPTGLLRTKGGMQLGKEYSQEDVLRLSRFLTGNAAMSIGSFGQAVQLQNADANHLPVFQWGIADPPVDPRHSDESYGYTIGDVFAIPAKSAHAEEAWVTIRTLVSPEIEKSMLKSFYGSDPTTSGWMASIPSVMNGFLGKIDPKPFYDLKPALPSPTASSLMGQLSSIGTTQARSAAAGQITAQEAFDAFWRQAEPILQGGGQP